jgi:serine/threonine-protein kinase
VATQQHDTGRVTVPPGTRFGRYEVIAAIASGGMATVYLGRALGAAGFQRLVAIKCLHPHVAADEEFVTMFMDEARLAARIRHPNVVPTLDLSNGEDGLFLVMEYVEGDGLLSLLRNAVRTQTRMPVPVALRIALDTLQGLHAAHELTGDRGEPLRLVHRDISPHNILVGVDGIARITDFGIARAEERLGVTRDGQVKGKLAYMAPEQTSGNPVDRRADLFSTGVVLWECLAGKRLFQGQNDGEVLRNLLVNPIPRLRDVSPDLPAALDEVCARALSRDPDERFATAAQFADALEEAGGSVGIGSARAVSKYVRQVSGAKIEAMERQVRAVLGDSGARSVVRPATRPRAETDPERTTLRSEPPELVPAAAPTSASPGTDGSEPPRTSEPAISAPPVPVASAAPAPASPARAVLVAVLLVLFFGVVGAGGVALWRLRRSDPPPRIGRPVIVGNETGPAVVPAAVVPAVVPLAPEAGVVAAPAETTTPAPPMSSPEPSRPARATQRPRTPATTAPRPSRQQGGQEYNPEAM